MSSSIPNPNNGKRITGYGVGAPSIRLNPPPIVAARSPTSLDLKYPFGQDWINTTAQLAFTLVGVTAGAAVWATTGGATGVIDTLTGGSGGAISPIAGNITLAGTANQITTTGTAGTITFSLPSAITAPGSLTTTTSLAATTTITAGTGITATTGNIAASAGNVSASGTVTAGTTVTATLGDITATNGNFVSTAAGKGIVLNSGTTSGTTTGTLNGRSGQVTITTPTINAGATFSFALTNSSITGSGTQVLYGLTGGTTGSAITIQSVTNSGSTSTVVVQNASAVTNSTGSLVLTFLVLN